jgi:hypothetical protein
MREAYCGSLDWIRLGRLLLVLVGSRGESSVSSSADVEERSGVDGAEREGALIDARVVVGLGAKDRLTCSTTRARDWLQPLSRGRVVADPSIKWIRTFWSGSENVISSMI